MIQVPLDCFIPSEGNPDFVLGTGSARIRYQDIQGIITHLSKFKEGDKISLPYSICSGVNGNYIALSYKK